MGWPSLRGSRTASGRMDEFNRLEAKGLARAKLRAKRRRVSAIRSRAALGSMAIFAVAWAIIFGQLVTGNDPVLNRAGLSLGRPVASTHRKSPAVAPEAQSEEEEELAAAPAAAPRNPKPKPRQKNSNPLPKKSKLHLNRNPRPNRPRSSPPRHDRLGHGGHSPYLLGDKSRRRGRSGDSLQRLGRGGVADRLRTGAGSPKNRRRYAGPA